MSDIRKPELLEHRVVLPIESLVAYAGDSQELALKYELDLIANLARVTHREGRRFTGWPEVFVERNGHDMTNTIFGSVWTVPR